MNLHMYGSMFLIGLSLALAAVVGVLQPPSHRATVLLALLGGIGVGITGLALSWSTLQNAKNDDLWRVFFNSSIAGFVAVVAVLAMAWRRARPRTSSSRVLPLA
jgi:NADH:ubiquinone oxidoreductase subunit 6 (subunit J)